MYLEIKFGDGRYNTFTPTMSVCIWTASRSFNTTDCSMVFNTVLDLKIDLGGIRARFRYPCASTHHRGPFEHIKFRIFLPRSSPPCLDHQNHDLLGKLELKVTGVVTNTFSTNFFLNLFSIDRSPRGIVHINSEYTEIHSTRHISPKYNTTEGCIKTTSKFRSKSVFLNFDFNTITNFD